MRVFISRNTGVITFKTRDEWHNPYGPIWIRVYDKKYDKKLEPGISNSYKDGYKGEVDDKQIIWYFDLAPSTGNNPMSIYITREEWLQKPEVKMAVLSRLIKEVLDET